MSSDEDSLSDSSSGGNDTDELIAASEKTAIAAKKKKPAPKRRLQKKSAKKASSIPDADNDSDGDDNLFDSDDDSDESVDNAPQKPSKLKKKSFPDKSSMSKRERMELLAKRRAIATGTAVSEESVGKKDKERGYDSGNSYDSGTEYARTKEDDDFIDFDGEDEEARLEYAREQKFEDERPEGEYSDDEAGKKHKRKNSSKKRSTSQLDGVSLVDTNNPVTQAILRMKKKKKVTKSDKDLDEAATAFVREMEQAAEEDDRSIKARKPATKKLRMLPKVVEMLTQKSMVRYLLDADPPLLVVAKRWIQPLPNGALGNVTVRQAMIDSVAKMGTGDQGIMLSDLKNSDFGKLIMQLYKHKNETPTMKRKLKSMIEEYSRVVFGKSGNMKDLSHESYRRQDGGLAEISRQQAADAAASANYARNGAARRKSRGSDLGSLISKATKTPTNGKSRVSVPYSKGFQFTVRPENKSGEVASKHRKIQEKRRDLHKRIEDRRRGLGPK